MNQTLSDKFDVLRASVPANLQKIRSFRSPGAQPSRGISYGVGAVDEIGAAAIRLGANGTVLIVSDPVLEALGLVDLVAARLEASGLVSARFTDVKPEPVVENVIEAEAEARRVGAELVIGLGGGSAMDVAKVVAVGLGGRVSGQRYVSDPSCRAGAGRAPLILVPTTSGTGSEVSEYAIILEGKEKRLIASPDLLPDLALLDPLLTMSMPRSVTAATGLDALTHAIEGMTNLVATPINDGLSLAAITMIGRSLRRAANAPDDVAARYDMLVASAFAMMSFNLSGGLWAHSVSYVLGSAMPTPHGLGCALGLPSLLRFNQPTVAAQHAQIATALGMDAANGDCPVADAVEGLMKDVGMPVSLREHGIDEADLDALSEAMTRLYPRVNNPRPMSGSEARAYWQAMFEARA